jgi:MFS family permease
LTFFAGKYGGGDCQLTPKSDACRRASSDAAVYHGVAGAISHSVAWLFALMLGSFSDKHGRRPILLAAALLAILSRISLASHLMGVTSLWVFLVVEPTLTIFDVHGVFLAVMNDVVRDPKQRIIANSVTMGVMFGSGGLAGLLGGTLSSKAAVTISLTLGALQVIFLMWSFPETVSARLRGGIEDIGQDALNLRDLMRDSAQLLRKSPFIQRMTSVLIFSSLSATGFQNTFMPYLTAYLGFTQHENGQLMVACGISIVAAFVLGMKILLSVFGEIYSMRLLLALKVVFYLLCAASWTAPQVFLVHFLLVGPVVLLIPIMAAIQSNLAGDEEQGRMQGILTAVKIMATAFGEIVFAGFYRYSTSGGANPNRFSALPGIFAAIALAMVAFMLASSLDPRGASKSTDEPGELSMAVL